MRASHDCLPGLLGPGIGAVCKCPRQISLVFAAAGPLLSRRPVSDYPTQTLAETLLNLLPADGSTIGNQSLCQELARKTRARNPDPRIRGCSG